MSSMITPSKLANSTSDEHSHQVALMQWVLWHAQFESKLKYLFAIPNGGARDKRTASNLKAEGVKAGVSDLMLPVARHNRHGLFIEMKKFDGGSGESKEQIEWGESMHGEGYGYVCCHGWKAAAKVLMQYLGFSERAFPDGIKHSECPD